MQSLWVTPLILEAETYESAAPVAAHSHAANTAHDHHDADAWAPQDGAQRTLFTGLSNLVVAVGFALMLRQCGWVGTAASAAAGLALLAFAGQWWLRLLGLLLLPLPYLVGAPQPEVHQSLVPTALSQHFIVTSLLVNALFWAALGLISAWLFTRGQRVN